MGPETTNTSGHNPGVSAARSEAARKNGAHGGRPRVQFDWAQYSRLTLDDLSVKDVARELGVSRRTVKRRLTERQRDESPF